MAWEYLFTPLIYYKKREICIYKLFHILMPYNIILYFRLPYFDVSNSALFSTWYFSTLILYRRSLDTFQIYI